MYKIVIYTADFKVSDIVRTNDYELVEDGIYWDKKTKAMTNVGRPFIAVDADRDIATITLAEVMEWLLPPYLNRLSNECEQEIYKGFHSTTMNAHFTFDVKDQDNFNQQLTMILLGDEDPIEWKTEDKGIIVMSKDQFIAVSKEIKEHKRNWIGKSWAVKQSIIGRVKSYKDLDAIGTFAEEIKKLEESAVTGTTI